MEGENPNRREAALRRRKAGKQSLPIVASL
jgi:hypothetical protein